MINKDNDTIMILLLLLLYRHNSTNWVEILYSLAFASRQHISRVRTWGTIGNILYALHNRV